ncbi:MAG: hypothetical protein ACKOEL_10230 [Planctomycetota bacterium]
MNARLIAAVGLSALALSTASAFADIEILEEANPVTKKGVEAIVEECSDEVMVSVVYTKVDGQWEVDECATDVVEFAKEVEAPFKEELELWSFITTDCNGNGQPDSADIAAGAADWDVDGTPDSCEYGIGDLNLNGTIDNQDVSILLGWWGIPNPQFGDLNSDGKVDGADMGILLGRWGAVVF